MSLDSKTWVVIPGYNEAATIGRVIEKVKKITSHIIVVDDGSNDKTAEVARQSIDDVLSHAINLGKGSALKTGVDYAFKVKAAEAVILLDADDQHDPAEIPLFLEQLNKGETIILGVRNLRQKMPWMRSKGNHFLSQVIGVLFGVYIPDILSGYKAFHKSAYPKLKWYSRAYGVEMELAIRIAKYRLPFVTIPIKTIYHNFDRGMTLLDSAELFIQIITWRLFL